MTASENHVHRSVEILIGRLVTDDEFRAEYRRDPHALLSSVGNLGLELSAGEVRALLRTDLSLWERIANEIDPRLRKASLAAGTELDQS